MNDLAILLAGTLRTAMPDIRVVDRPWPDDPSRRELTFTTSAFAGLYLRQRYHRLVHAIPRDVYDRHLTNAVFIELAPGESRADLVALDLDDEHVRAIEHDVLRVVERAGFTRTLDAALALTPCTGTFRETRAILSAMGHDALAVTEACHVFMRRGGSCDCEVVPNVFRGSREAHRFWSERHPELEP